MDIDVRDKSWRKVEWRKVEWKKPFTMPIQFVVDGQKLRGDAFDWVAAFTTGGVKKYVASRKGGVLTNCTIDSKGVVNIIFSDYRLEAGRMSCELRSTIEGEEEVTRFATGIELASSGDDLSDFVVEVELPYSGATEIAKGEWKKVEWRRTFTMLVQIMIEGLALRGDAFDWVATFTTGGVKKYVASRMGNMLVNCSIDADGKVRILFNDYELEAGKVSCEMLMYFTENGKTRKDVTRFEAGIELVSGEGDKESEFGIEVLLPYANYGLTTDKLWDELAKVDSTKVIDSSHIPNGVYVFPYSLSEERNYTISQEVADEIMNAVGKNKIVFANVDAWRCVAEYEIDENGYITIEVNRSEYNEIRKYTARVDLFQNVVSVMKVELNVIMPASDAKLIVKEFFQ